jgi:hypothetical protein
MVPESAVEKNQPDGAVYETGSGWEEAMNCGDTSMLIS